jgi:hypothetical protein
VTAALATQVARRDAMELGIDQLHQARHGLFVSTGPLVEQPRDLMVGRFGHACPAICGP